MLSWAVGEICGLFDPDARNFFKAAGYKAYQTKCKLL